MSHHEHEHHSEHDTDAGGEQHQHGTPVSHIHHHHQPEISEGTQFVVCPVMTNNLVNIERAEEQGLYRDYKGQRYWFCCAACGPLWDAHPDKYAAA